AGDARRVEHAAGGDAADLEAEEAGGGRVGERLPSVDREGPDAAAERADVAEDAVGPGVGDLQVFMVATAEINVAPVQAHDRVVRPVTTLDRRDRVTVAAIEHEPRPARAELADRHVDATAVGRDRHAVDPGRIGTLPQYAPGEQVVRQHRPGAGAAAAPAVADGKGARAR